MFFCGKPVNPIKNDHLGMMNFTKFHPPFISMAIWFTKGFIYMGLPHLMKINCDPFGHLAIARNHWPRTIAGWLAEKECRSIGTNVLSPWIANRNVSMSFCGRSFSINVPQNIGESPGAWLFTPSRHSWTGPVRHRYWPRCVKIFDRVGRCAKWRYGDFKQCLNDGC